MIFRIFRDGNISCHSTLRTSKIYEKLACSGSWIVDPDPVSGKKAIEERNVTFITVSTETQLLTSPETAKSEKVVAVVSQSVAA